MRPLSSQSAPNPWYRNGLTAGLVRTPTLKVFVQLTPPSLSVFTFTLLYVGRVLKTGRSIKGHSWRDFEANLGVGGTEFQEIALLDMEVMEC